MMGARVCATLNGPMTLVNKTFLLCLSGALVLTICGCGSSYPPTPPNGFLYAGNSGRPGSMAAYSITSGTLGHILNSPFTTNSNAAYTLAAWPPPLPSPAAAVTTKFVYGGVPASSLGGVINRILGNPPGSSVTGGIIMMPIDTSTHTLGTPVFMSGGDYDPIAVSPTANFLYAIDLTTDTLAAFSIDSNTGALTAIGPQGPPVGLPVGPDPFNVIVDPQGKFVFVANCDCRTSPSNHGSVQVFSINSDGTLTSVGTFVAGGVATSQPDALAIMPDSTFLFVASLDNTVYVESIAANGALTSVACPPIAPNPVSPCVLPANSTPVSIAVSTDGSYVYTANAGTHTLSFFINCAETNANTTTPCMGITAPLLIPSFDSSVALGGTPGALISDATNPPSSVTTITSISGFMYVTNYDNGTVQPISITSVDGCTGIVNCVPGTPNLTGAAMNSGGVNPFGLAIAH
jgi:DNA-binding beta-propeller fold protein YncE